MGRRSRGQLSFTDRRAGSRLGCEGRRQNQAGHGREGVPVSTDLELNAALERIAAKKAFAPCSACGEPGTWGESGMCPDCETVAKASERAKGLTPWQLGLAELGVPPVYLD